MSKWNEAMEDWLAEVENAVEDLNRIATSQPYPYDDGLDVWTTVEDAVHNAYDARSWVWSGLWDGLQRMLEDGLIDEDPVEEKIISLVLQHVKHYAFPESAGEFALFIVAKQLERWISDCTEHSSSYPTKQAAEAVLRKIVRVHKGDLDSEVKLWHEKNRKAMEDEKV